MIHNVLDNRRFDSWLEFRNFVRSIHDMVPTHVWSSSSSESYRRLRMITNQYLINRKSIQSLDSLRQVESWLNADLARLFNVPFNHLDVDDRNFSKPCKIWFRNMAEDAAIDTNFYIGIPDEEALFGKGWTGELVIELERSTSNATGVGHIKQGLGAYGIYTLDIDYDPGTQSRKYVLSIAMLERDFKFKNFNESEWFHLDLSEDDIFDSLTIDDIDRWERDQIFDDDAQYLSMGFDDEFE